MFLLLNSVSWEDVAISEILESFLEVYGKGIDLVNFLAFLVGVLSTITVYVIYTVIRDAIRDNKKKSLTQQPFLVDELSLELNKAKSKLGEPDE